MSDFASAVAAPVAERLHTIIKASAPTLSPKT